MKTAIVKYIGQSVDPVEGILLESVQDVADYMEFVKSKENSIITKFIKSGETANRLDHIVSGFEPTEKSLASYACAFGHLRGTNPLYEIPNALTAKMNTALKILSFFGHVFINPAGGMTTLLKGSVELIEARPFEGYKENKGRISLVAGAKVINLENDPYLERVAVKYMKSRWDKFSSIKELILFDKNRLQNVFESFKAKGGEVIYVYTTGRNVEQMYEYSEAALHAGLNDFVFDFNCGTDKDINKFVNWLSERANVELIHNAK